MLIETAYPWTLLWKDNTHNPVGLPEHVLPGYPATPDGQSAFIRKLWDHVYSGICYWAPEYIAAPRFGSHWENLALFDFDGEVLPGASALGAGTPTSSDAPPSPFSIECVPQSCTNWQEFGEYSVGQSEHVGLLKSITSWDNAYGHRQPYAEEDIILSLSGLPVGTYWIRHSWNANHALIPCAIVHPPVGLLGTWNFRGAAPSSRARSCHRIEHLL